jgi:hypothetical protein
MKGPKAIPHAKCIHCGDRDCYGKCDSYQCNCTRPCDANDCNAHYLFEKMSTLNGAHPHYYSVEYYCEECERLGCICCKQCGIPSHQCNCYGQNDDIDYDYGSDEEEHHEADDADEADEANKVDEADDADEADNADDADDADEADDQDIEEKFNYTCCECNIRKKTSPGMIFKRLCSNFYCNNCFDSGVETLGSKEIISYYNTSNFENGYDGWYNPETDVFHIGQWINKVFEPYMDDERNIRYYST